MIISTRAVCASVTPANLRSPVLATGSISNRDWKLLETPVTDRKHEMESILIETKLHPQRAGMSSKCGDNGSGNWEVFENFGGADGVRTRDLLRDRQAF